MTTVGVPRTRHSHNLVPGLSRLLIQAIPCPEQQGEAIGRASSSDLPLSFKATSMVW